MKSRAELNREPRTAQFECGKDSALITNAPERYQDAIRDLFPVAIWVQLTEVQGTPTLDCGCQKGYLVTEESRRELLEMLNANGIPSPMQAFKRVYACEHMGRIIE